MTKAVQIAWALRRAGYIHVEKERSRWNQTPTRHHYRRGGMRAAIHNGHTTIGHNDDWYVICSAGTPLAKVLELAEARRA